MKPEIHFIKIAFKILILSLLSISCEPVPDKTEAYTISESALMDKIKGGWAGQVIGVTYGGPTEFRYNGTLMQDYIPIAWNEDQCEWWYENIPGLYDDVYMDLTFVEIIEKEGIHASAELHAKAFAYADYPLWHANQAARNNIINNILPPQSGHWKYNPHADDIDFQIEADFAGLMSPGMVNAAAQICDTVGHIMNYGDGWYGGVYVAALYANAFVSNDIEEIVSQSLKAIPKESKFFQCISDVINWWKAYPDDWKQTWFEVQKKWSEDVGCPDGVFSAFNIDAKINAAYAVIGLLYGQGDYGKTLEISTRCGLDSDCNPATAGGVLGTILGYDNIPEYWKKPLYRVEDKKFKFTNWSLNDVYQVGFKHAKNHLELYGATTENGIITIPRSEVIPVRLEEGWKDLIPVSNENQQTKITATNPVDSFTFEGVGFLLKGFANNLDRANLPDHIFEIQVTVDGEVQDTIFMTTEVIKRRLDIAWKYDLDSGTHQVIVEILNPKENYELLIGELFVYRRKSSKE